MALTSILPTSDAYVRHQRGPLLNFFGSYGVRSISQYIQTVVGILLTEADEGERQARDFFEHPEDLKRTLGRSSASHEFIKKGVSGVRLLRTPLTI